MATEARPPSEWPPDTLAAFESLVRAGGEVAGAGLATRIAQAKVLSCHWKESQLQAIAALKNPRQSYRAKTAGRSDFELAEDRYPFELGWVYVVPEHRGAGLSRAVVEACLASAGAAGVFATRANNEPMQRTLKRHGFRRTGSGYKSERGAASLVLFIRDGDR